MIEPRLPRYQWGQRVKAQVNLHNDGSFPDAPLEALLVNLATSVKSCRSERTPRQTYRSTWSNSASASWLAVSKKRSSLSRRSRHDASCYPEPDHGAAVCASKRSRPQTDRTKPEDPQAISIRHAPGGDDGRRLPDRKPMLFEEYRQGRRRRRCRLAVARSRSWKVGAVSKGPCDRPVAARHHA